MTTNTDGRLLNRWTRAGLTTAISPLILWGAASVFMISVACGVSVWIAWVPALSTSGVMLASTLISLQSGLDRRIRHYAGYLAAFAVVLDALVAGVQHTLPATIDAPLGVKFLIGLLPSVMGGLLVHIWAMAHAQERREASELAAREARAETEREARIEADRVHAAELAASRELAETAERETAARRRAQETAAREVATNKAALDRVAAPAPATVVKPVPLHAVPSVREAKRPTKPAGTVDALGRAARPAPKRDAALKYLIQKCRAGELDGVTAAEVDRHIGANNYAKRLLDGWKRDVREHVERERGVA